MFHLHLIYLIYHLGRPRPRQLEQAPRPSKLAAHDALPSRVGVEAKDIEAEGGAEKLGLAVALRVVHAQAGHRVGRRVVVVAGGGGRDKQESGVSEPLGNPLDADFAGCCWIHDGPVM
jgi:hypothetical protein